MPLRGIVDGRTITGPDLSHEEWADLARRHKKGLPVTMACCGAAGHLRVSGKGLQHFYHATGTGCRYAEESPAHLHIKDAVCRACRAAGWDAQVEQPAPDRSFISDVCARKDNRTVVFEIQVSAISPSDLAERDAQYGLAGIESYWLLAGSPNRPRVFAAWYDACLAADGGPRAGDVPFIDDSLFFTGPENQLFFAKGIRSIGLHVKDAALYTTNNPAIPVALWVREVLNGNYLRYLDETRAAIRHRRRLLTLAAPLLERARAFYPAVRDRTFHKRLDALARNRGAAQRGPAFRRRSGEIASEIDWFEKEYRAMVAEETGLFTWKKAGRQGMSRPVFRLESGAKVRQLQERVAALGRWETSFEAALRALEREAVSRR